MRGTVDPEVLKTWVIMLDDMLRFARGKTPDDILDLYREKRSGIIQDVFHHHEIFYSMGCLEERLSDALPNVYKLASCENWDNQILQEAWGKSKTSKKKFGKTPEELIQDYFESLEGDQIQPMYGVNIIEDDEDAF